LTEREPIRRVLLVGFMGAGKTTVGRSLAEVLGWSFVDFDDEIERRAGATVAQIFEGFGEARFREMEAEVALSLLGRTGVVLASGGGWAAESPGMLGDVPEGTFVVWLDVGAEEAVRRAGGDARRRPLLEARDPVRRARDLLQRRAPRYAEADWRVDTEHSSVDDVTARILEILRNTGWEKNTE
jgi:shikimate kinase